MKLFLPSHEEENRVTDILSTTHIFGKHALMFGSFHVWSLIIIEFCNKHLVTANCAAEEVCESMLEGGGTQEF